MCTIRCVKCAPLAALLVDSKRLTLTPPSKLYTMKERVIHKSPTWLPGNGNLSALPDRRAVQGQILSEERRAGGRQGIKTTNTR